MKCMAEPIIFHSLYNKAGQTHTRETSPAPWDEITQTQLAPTLSKKKRLNNVYEEKFFLHRQTKTESNFVGVVLATDIQL